MTYWYYSKKFNQVFTNLSKAFDTVNHSISLHKSELYGIKGKCLNWFHSYLKHCQQLVLLGKNENSIYRRIVCVVPQDSILGLLLFHICINDLLRSSSKLAPIMSTEIQIYLFPKPIQFFLKQ